MIKMGLAIVIGQESIMSRERKEGWSMKRPRK